MTMNIFKCTILHMRPKSIRTIIRHDSTAVPSWLKAMTGLQSYKVRQIGDPILREKSKPVQYDYMFSPEFAKIIDVMLKTMRERKAVGIAAPQIGASLRVIAVEFNGQHIQQNIKKFGANGIKKMHMQLYPLQIVINPVMKIIDPTTIAFKEGCLSMEGYSAIVPRMKEVQISGLGRKGENLKFNVSGWIARIFQHEIDHLDGHLYFDSMQYKTLIYEKWKDHLSS